jgi:hypothetical protein
MLTEMQKEVGFVTLASDIMDSVAKPIDNNDPITVKARELIHSVILGRYAEDGHLLFPNMQLSQRLLDMRLINLAEKAETGAYAHRFILWKDDAPFARNGIWESEE